MSLLYLQQNILLCKASIRNTMKLLIVLLALNSVISSQSITIMPCSQFRQGICVKCPFRSHLHQGICYADIPGCRIYSPDQKKCLQCNSLVSYQFQFDCVFLSGFNQDNIYYIEYSNTGATNFYRPIDQISAQKDQDFNLVHKFLMTGEYKHFISSSRNPILSIQYYLSGNLNINQKLVKHYKIHYYGASGGIFLNIIKINVETKKIQIESLVPIGASRIIDNCIEYSREEKCVRCQDGHHLQQNHCYLNNVPNCLRFKKQICTKCSKFNLLVDNQCVGQCRALSDTRSISSQFISGNVTYQQERGYQINKN